MNSLAELRELVRNETGIVLSSTKDIALRAALGRAAPGVSPEAFLRLAADPVRGRALIDRLIDEVTVQETSFARDRSQLDSIGWPGLLRRAQDAGGDAIRVWSAGCATGEEPYTLAMFAAEAFAPAPPAVDVLGTDISRTALRVAADGRYRERAVRDLDRSLRQRYLSRADRGEYLVGKNLRGVVRFRRHNLAKDAIPPIGEADFDLIVCRNVLIYLDIAVATALIASFERSLRPGGTLMLGAADGLKRMGASPARRAQGGARQAEAGSRPLRRPLGRELVLTRDQRLTAVLDAAGAGDSDGVTAHLETLLASDPLDADAHFIAGLVALDAGHPDMAVDALRRALFNDASFAVAAFALGRAYDAIGDAPAARRAYEQALRTLDPDDRRHEALLEQVDLGDIAAACRARIGGGSADPDS